jgi:hypothetical protein
LLAFFKLEEDKVMAIIHTCESKVHSIEDSCLTEPWNLEYKRSVVNAEILGSSVGERIQRHIRQPALRVVEVETLRDRVYVVEKSPGLRESLLSGEETTLVVLVNDRKTFWPKYFTSTI